MADNSPKGPRLADGLAGAFEKSAENRVGNGGDPVLGERLRAPSTATPGERPPDEGGTQHAIETSPVAPKSFVPKAAFSPLSPPTLELPQGGGAIRGIGETLRTNPATGTAGFDIPLPLSPSPHGPTPGLSLSYDSGQGNGIFGAGWGLPIPQVTRKTDKKLPEYNDSEDSDTFLLSGAEDLVPFLDEEGERAAYEDGLNIVERFRPRTEGLYAIIERVKKPDGDIFWRSITRDHTTSTFGETTEARITDPSHPRRVFSWLLEKVEDAYGHVTTYVYKPETFENALRAAPSEAHRRDELAGFANTHLKEVRYANSTPGDGSTYQIQVVLDYGEHDAELPTPTAETTWPARQDPFSSYRAGFDMRTYRLCKRVLVFHKFPGLESGAATLVRSLDLAYDENPTMTKLTSATLKGYIKDGLVYTVKAMPPVVMTYSEPTFTRKITTLETSEVEDFPRQLLGKEAQFVDLDGEGLPGVLTRRGDALYYQRNRGDGTLTLQKCLPITPSLVTARDAQLTDVEGSGTMAVVSWSPDGAGFQLREGEGWGPFQTFASQPKVNWNDPNLRLVDLNGDGFGDILITRGDHFLWYPSLGKQGFGPARRVEIPQDERVAPSVVFNDVKMSIYLADMSGDGQADIVRIRNGKVSYWPNLGHGRFGAEVRMGNCPYLGNDEQFKNVQVRLADLDGSGTADMLFFSPKGMEVFFNRSGNSFSEGFLNPSVPAEALWTLQLVDYYGRGMTAVAWAPPEIGLIPAPLKITQPCGAEKPHLLKTIDNSMGKTVTFTYAPSTKFYAADRKARRPWATKLPFPVEVVEKIETYDAISRTRYVTSYSYHHGFYDTVEREFRGFGRVDQLDAEWFGAAMGAGTFSQVPPIEDHDDELVENDEFPQAPVLTKTWFHTGAWKTADRRSLEEAFLTESWLGDLVAIAAPRCEVPLDEELTPAELREAHRALRGTMIRQEVYGLDGSAEEDKPFAVVEQSTRVRLIQHQSPRRSTERPAFNAVFDAVPLEARTTTYERIANDPRTTQELALEVDDFGSVTQAVSIAYPRRTPEFDEQERYYMVVGESDFVSDTTREEYRLSVPTESRVYQLTDLTAPASGLYTRAELVDAFDGIDRIAYDAVPGGMAPCLRLLERVRTIYYKSDELPTALEFGEIDRRALPFESYRLDLLASQLTAVFGGDLDTADLISEGAYVELFEDEFWIPSGTATLNADHFFLPTKFTNPFGRDTTLTYDTEFNFALSVSDVYDNAVSAEIDHRLLRPSLTTDANGNQTKTVSDELGMVTKLVVMGKDGDGDGDTVDHPTVEYTVVLDEWNEHDRPNYIEVVAREEHFSVVPASTKFQISRTYSDGSGRVACAKAKFAPDGMTPRWVTSGKTVVNNKGNPVKQYEPFFSSTIDYQTEDAFAEVGVTPLMTYDALGRVTRVDLPNGSYRRSEWTPWLTRSFDENDTVSEGGNVWAADRADSTDAEERALAVTIPHANTPTVSHYDPMGRAFLAQAHNGFDGDDPILFETRIAFDIESQVLAVTDARDRVCQTNIYSAGGQLLSDTNLDKGNRLRVACATGEPLRRWDDRDQAFRYVYDAIRRPTHLFMKPGAGTEILLERRYYGDNAGVTDPQDTNVRGRLTHVFDGAGLAKTESFDFKGTPDSSKRQLATAFTSVPDWIDLDAVTSSATAETDAATAGDLEAETFEASAELDALGRPTTAESPDGSTTTYTYDEGGLLFGVSVVVHGVTQSIVDAITYDAHGRRVGVTYGNGNISTYSYDPLTFRLARVFTANGGTHIQDLAYTFDPVGNVIQVHDSADQPTFFDNSVVLPEMLYTYDPTYRLISASGREHASIGDGIVDDDDVPIQALPHANDAAAVRNYTETYEYDEVSNIKSLFHDADGSPHATWTRDYTYKYELSTGPDQISNRLHQVSGMGSSTFPHDDHGSITEMPHLPVIDYTPFDQMSHANKGGGGDVYFTYDASGNRVRKVWVHSGSRDERIYLGGYELYRSTDLTGPTVVQERETLHVMDGAQRVCMVETLIIDDPGGTPVTTPVPRWRFQLSNHLGSVGLECDEAGDVFSYEEYHPYGTSAYRSTASGADVSAKRYRYCGAERDEETGFSSMGMRSYCPWLGRWTTADPIGLAAGVNPFCYCRAGPVTFSDPSGLSAVQTPAAKPETVLQPTGKSVAKPSGGATTHADLSAEKAAATADQNLRYDPKKDQSKTVGADTSSDPVEGPVEDPMAMPWWVDTAMDPMKANLIEEAARDEAWRQNGWKFYVQTMVLGVVGVASGGVLVPWLAGYIGGAAGGVIAGAIVGGAEGVFGQGISDLLRGELSSGDDYWKSLVWGGVFGGVGGIGIKPRPRPGGGLLDGFFGGRGQGAPGRPRTRFNLLDESRVAEPVPTRNKKRFSGTWEDAEDQALSLDDARRRGKAAIETDSKSSRRLDSMLKKATPMKERLNVPSEGVEGGENFFGLLNRLLRSRNQ